MEKNRKKKWITSILAVGIAVPTVFYFSSHTTLGETPLQEAIDAFSQDHGQTVSEEKRPFIKVSGHEYTNQQFNTFKETRNLIQRNSGEAPLSDQEMEKEFIKNAVVLEEAKKQNLYVTVEEAKNYADKEKLAIQADPKSYAEDSLYMKYINTLGVTEEEYWTDVAIPGYQEALSIGKVKGKFIENQRAKNQNLTDEEAINAWEAEQARLINQANIEK